MIYSTATVPVNPHGQVTLTRDQLWHGLLLKVRDARSFLPPGTCTQCEVIFDAKDYLIREATIMGEELSEIVTFERKQKMSFFQRTGPFEGVIVNQILEDENGALLLKFYCLLGMRHAEQGGKEEQERQAQLDSSDRGYKAALLGTLARTRQLVQEGRI